MANGLLDYGAVRAPRSTHYERYPFHDLRASLSDSLYSFVYTRVGPVSNDRSAAPPPLPRQDTPLQSERTPVKLPFFCLLTMLPLSNSNSNLSRRLI